MINTKRKPFLIKSKNLEKLRPAFLKCSEYIKKSISEKRLIIVKHHDDVDGYTAGLVLEKAIIPLYKERKNFIRLASRTPYYDYVDALHDLNNYLSGYYVNPPLVLLCDLGSNEQSIKSIKRLKKYNFDFIIIDHHRYDSKNKEISKIFLNPHAYNLDSNICAGALATELALFINPLMAGIKHYPALSGVADKSSGSDHDSYVKLSGHSLKELEEWTNVIDHELYHLRFQARTKLIDDLFSKKLDLDIEKEFEQVEKAVKKYAVIKDYKKFKLLTIDRNKVGNWDYASSKITRITHDLVKGPKITLSINVDSFSYRADGVKFSGVDLISELKNKFPYALVSGGGHDSAGNIRFNQASKDEIMEFILKYLQDF